MSRIRVESGWLTVYSAAYPTSWQPFHHAAIPHVANAAMAHRAKYKSCGRNCFLEQPDVVRCFDPCSWSPKADSPPACATHTEPGGARNPQCHTCYQPRCNTVLCRAYTWSDHLRGGRFHDFLALNIDQSHDYASRCTPSAVKKCLMRMSGPPEATCNPYRRNGVRKELYSLLLR